MSAAIKLEIFQHGQLLQEIPVDGNHSEAGAWPDVWVGRDQACLIRLEDRAISRKHALFRVVDGGALEFEKKSKFGFVKLNGEESTRAFLKAGDCLELGGDYEIRVSNREVPKPLKMPPEPPTNVISIEPAARAKAEASALLATSEAAPESPSPSDDFAVGSAPEGVEQVHSQNIDLDFSNQAHADLEAPQPTGNLDFGSAQPDGATKVFNLPAHVKAILEFGAGTLQSSLYEINDDEVAIGRSQQCHVVLEDKKSSRKHVILKREGSKYILKDLGSANGTLVNQVRVHDEQELHSGDQIQIGETAFTFKVVQADYEQKKEQFAQVPPPELLPPTRSLSDFGLSSVPQSFYQNLNTETPPPAAPEQAFQALPPEKKKSIIGRALDRYRLMNTRQQIIWSVLIIGGLYVFMFDDDPSQHAKLAVNQKKISKKQDDKRIGGPTYESLTPEQQRYVETQYQLAFELYKNREYDKSLLELNGVFNLVKDYKNAREIESFAREGKRKLEAQEDERKRKEAERQAQLKLQSMLEQAGLFMDKKRFKEAEALFPDIELLQPENAAVNEWRKQIMVEAEKLEQLAMEKKALEVIRREQWAEFQKGLAFEEKKQYIDALEVYDEVSERPNLDKKLLAKVKEETTKTEGILASLRDPLLQEAKAFETDGKLIEAYRSYSKASEIDPGDDQGPAGMKRISGTLTARAKYLYTEGVFAESYSDVDTAEKKFREVLEVAPKEDDYYAKAQGRLKKLTVLRKPATETPQ
jgi:pSer/pThr/pTyr-binding forkhead associated (FHA) protein